MVSLPLFNATVRETSTSILFYRPLALLDPFAPPDAFALPSPIRLLVVFARSFPSNYQAFTSTRSFLPILPYSEIRTPATALMLPRDCDDDDDVFN